MVRICLINCGSSKVQAIKSILNESGCATIIIGMEETNSYDFSRFQGIIISGGAHLFTDMPENRNLIDNFSFLDSLSIPTLGICLGHQAIGLHAGADIFLGEKRNSYELININNKHPLFYDLPSQVAMETEHCEGITLPEGFANLGSSVYYAVEAMASMDRHQYGVQFHPEISGESGKTIFRNFIKFANDYHLKRINGDCMKTRMAIKDGLP